MSLLATTIAQIGPLDQNALEAARARQDQLTKPQGSLGRLEQLALQIAAITGQSRPRLSNPAVVVMAADHGIARQGVSAFPMEVTPQMVLNFLHGGAAINVLARHVGSQVVVVDMGVASDLPPHADLRVHKLGYGTNDFSQTAAMSREQAKAALETGITVANELIDSGIDLIATGDMGIGNTTASSAIVAAISGQPVAEVTGRGTGLDNQGLQRKIALISAALELHQPDRHDGLDVLAKVGGFELGGLAGVMIGAAARRVPVVVDGFISGAAALIACTVTPSLQPYLIAAHRSVERGHQAIFGQLDLEPLLDLNLRLGEGTGAVLGFSLCQAACKVLDEMATFGEAGVADKV
ncbi:nicotinate-nucleotide--dimethylbenzimidazole phosphoribosyltransferase [Candidatus Viridilinea mediisalina]|uniref:Nicotinate-nucleotide--dimethylbenzimidazole phosphoribosyltransferase n=1 Tax=Candidatus Viridilinea mediisalina TaxID=2024553 RepID=A0A2A6RMN6_9CHLR|nr:nicotinate-nucleotide--dimethylbenzimidazole phosphoribosyltransferase [Candidatus Viridilinea mediisalina]PDW04354.1 nicotinate-nucleotide--dimethylbenzimidazole phosphoribosyltransferase [Candidatus Viridilinea mediisalina]